MVMVVPKLLDVVKLNTIDDLPDSPSPYWVAAQEGLYLRKKTALGVCILLEKKSKFPNDFKSMGKYKEGYFSFSGPKIPKSIINQAYSFFRKVFEANSLPNHKTAHCEAEVFILRDSKNVYSLFIPWQYTTHMGVNSIYDNADIPEDTTIIGTIHSHCDFDAFHSATDEGDASDFNGLHINIGHVNTDKPSMDAMIMINKEKFTYDLSVVTEDSENPVQVVDVSQDWFKFLYDDAEKLIDQYFPTLTKEELTEFVKECRGFSLTSLVSTGNSIPKGNSYTASWEDDDDWRNWRDWGTSGSGKNYGSYLNSTKYSGEFGKSLPREWFKNPETYGDYRLSETGIEKALTSELEKLFDIASKYGIFVEYELLNMYSEIK